MVKWTLAIVTLSCLSLLGCAPTIPKLIQMRQITGADSALAAQEDLIGYFAKPSDSAVWRAEAMKTMAHIDSTFSLASFHPGVHRDVERLFMDEYSSPKTTPEVSPLLRHKLKSWSVNMLGQLDRPYYLEFYLRVLERHNKITDTDYAIRLAAVNGVLSEMTRLSKYKGLRQRLLSTCASLKGEIRIAITGSQQKILSAIKSIEVGLLSYEDIVDLLPDDPQDMPDAKLLELLSWNHNALLAGQHKGKTDIYETNKLKLLGLIYHKNAKVRLRARSILADVDPYPLLKQLAPHVEDPQRATANDFIHTMRLIGALQDKMTADPQYRRFRQQAVNAFFKQLNKQSAEVRIEAYSALTKAVPGLLAEKLVASNKSVMTANQRNIALLQIDFMNRLRKSPALKDNKVQQQALLQAIGDWMGVRSMTLRTRVAAILLKDAPGQLAVSVGRCLPKISTESTESAKYLVEAYINAMNKLEKGTLDSDFEKAILREFGVAPYQLLLGGLAKESYEIRSIIANYMSKRNPSAFALAMAARLNTKLPVKGTEQFRIFGLLGDFALKHRDVLKPAHTKAVTQALRKGLKANNEDTILLCCRYIFELGDDVDEKDLAKPNRSVQALIRLAKKEGK